MKRRIRIRGYKGERSKPQTYSDWVETHGTERIPPVQEWDGCQPWSVRASTDLEDDYIEAFEKLVPTLKGRQRQIADLLVEGILNQAEIGRQLGMDRRTVVIHLRRIEKKIKNSVCG